MEMLIVNIFKYSLHILFYFPKTDLLKYFGEKKSLFPQQNCIFLLLCVSVIISKNF